MLKKFWESASEISKKANENPIILLLFVIAAILTIVLAVSPIYAWYNSPPLEADISCPYCEETGKDPNAPVPTKANPNPTVEPCPICKGHGHFRTDRVGQRDCVFCKGSGRMTTSKGIEPCKVCNGIGLEPKP